MTRTPILRNSIGENTSRRVEIGTTDRYNHTEHSVSIARRRMTTRLERRGKESSRTSTAIIERCGSRSVSKGTGEKAMGMKGVLLSRVFDSLSQRFIVPSAPVTNTQYRVNDTKDEDEPAVEKVP